MSLPSETYLCPVKDSDQPGPSPILALPVTTGTPPLRSAALPNNFFGQHQLLDVLPSLVHLAAR